MGKLGVEADLEQIYYLDMLSCFRYLSGLIYLTGTQGTEEAGFHIVLFSAASLILL